jgi:hypothetical protein
VPCSLAATTLVGHAHTSSMLQSRPLWPALTLEGLHDKLPSRCLAILGRSSRPWSVDYHPRLVAVALVGHSANANAWCGDNSLPVHSLLSCYQARALYGLLVRPHGFDAAWKNVTCPLCRSAQKPGRTRKQVDKTVKFSRAARSLVAQYIHINYVKFSCSSTKCKTTRLGCHGEEGFDRICAACSTIHQSHCLIAHKHTFNR